MLARPDTYAIDMEPLKSSLAMPYTLTPGRAAGAFLAEVANRRIVGSKFKNSGKVTVPAQDFCPISGDAEFDLIEAPATGTLTAFTETQFGLIGLVRIDGSDVDFPHQILGARYDDLNIGDRVEAVWSDEPVETSILNIAGFKLSPNAPVGQIKPLENPAEQVEVVKYAIDLKYEHAFGPYYGRMFDEIKNNRRIMGVRVPDGSESAYLPPRETCDITHKQTGTWVEVAHTGTVRAMSIINFEFVGQKKKPPYVYAEIKLDGASTRLIHNVYLPDFTMEKAKAMVKPGTRVRAVWSDKRTGSMDDISHFEIIDQ
ncbi:MAG: OB-fold domain-containing protein [Porticoccaceae bacterium]|nr:OB-fold domain-containing protein [Porticoccaceae bacterium]